MNVLLNLSRWIDGLSRWINKGLIWLILATTLLSAANAIARKSFHFGSNALLEIQWYLYASVFLLGASATFLQNGHVRIDVLASRLRRKTRMFIDIIGILVFLLPLCYFMARFAWPMVERAYLSGELSSNAGGLLRWPVLALIPLGFILLGLQAISELIKRFGYLTGHCEYPFSRENEQHHSSEEQLCNAVVAPDPESGHEAEK